MGGDGGIRTLDAFESLLHTLNRSRLCPFESRFAFLVANLLLLDGELAVDRLGLFEEPREDFALHPCLFTARGSLCFVSPNMRMCGFTLE